MFRAYFTPNFFTDANLIFLYEIYYTFLSGAEECNINGTDTNRIQFLSQIL